MTPKVNFKIFSINYLFPHLRSRPYFREWMKAVISQMFRLQGIFQEYQDGFDFNNGSFYNSGTVYNYDEECVFNYKIYKSLIDSNTGNTPDISPDEWEEISPCFLGTKKLRYFGNGRLNKEYALNSYFKRELDDNGLTGFKQPDSPTSPTSSDIYIDNVPVVYASFLVGTVNQDLGFLSTQISTGFVSTVEVFASSSTYAFNINIPTLVFASINSDPIIAESIVRRFFDKYVASCTKYNVITY